MRLGDLLGSLFSGAAGAQDGAHVRVWNQLKPWLANLSQSATTKWLPYLAYDQSCEVPLVRRGAFSNEPCQHQAVAMCDVCRRPVCLHHARIDAAGDAICYICVTDAIRVVPPVQRERARTGASQPPRGAPEEEAKPAARPPPSPQDVAKARKILGVTADASWSDVCAAHRKLSAQNHPDKQRTAKQRAEAEKRFVNVQKAFQVLKHKYPEAA